MIRDSSFDYVDFPQVNFLSYVKLAVLAMPALVRGRATKSHPGSIIVVSSGAGKLPCTKQAIYSGSKHALLGFFDSLRLEIENKKIPVTVTTVVLGLVDTDTAVKLTSGDVKMPMAAASEAALALLRAGQAGLEEVFYPASQTLHLAAALRSFPGLRYVLDRINLAMSGGGHGNI